MILRDDGRIEGLLRELAPRALGALVRRYHDFDDAEDALQEALLQAAEQWPADGIPDNPYGWLVAVASRRLVDAWRSDSARRRRETNVLISEQPLAAEPAEPESVEVDDSLELFLLCCHPALTRPSQLALTLRAVAGLTTAEIARALLVPEGTVAQRISRAKARVRAAGARFGEPTDDLGGRVATVAAVLYLIFTEGHTASSGDALHRVDLALEAIQLTRLLRARSSSEPALADYRSEIDGLLALMLLTQARASARVAADGALVPLAEQDRSRWDPGAIAEGIELVTDALVSGVRGEQVLGPYQVQAAIAAVHAEAPTADATDWPEILGLYDVLAELAPGPMVTLNRIVAVAMVRGERAALLELDVAAAAPVLVGHHRVHAVRAHLLERIGERAAAAAEFREAARGTLSLPEQRYLTGRAAALN